MFLWLLSTPSLHLHASKLNFQSAVKGVTRKSKFRTSREASNDIKLYVLFSSEPLSVCLFLLFYVYCCLLHCTIYTHTRSFPHCLSIRCCSVLLRLKSILVYFWENNKRSIKRKQWELGQVIRILNSEGIKSTNNHKNLLLLNKVYSFHLLRSSPLCAYDEFPYWMYHKWAS
jgi:hypothetical protein